jgi:hypothetical protein
MPSEIFGHDALGDGARLAAIKTDATGESPTEALLA